MTEPPLLPGTVKATDALELPAIATPMIGASGTVAGVTLLDGAEGALLGMAVACPGTGPAWLDAVTVHVTGTPFESPLTRRGEAVPVALCAPQVAV